MYRQSKTRLIQTSTKLTKTYMHTSFACSGFVVFLLRFIDACFHLVLCSALTVKYILVKLSQNCTAISLLLLQLWTSPEAITH